MRRGVPVAKIIKQKWFYGLKFYTNRHTLDPRPDTETLVAAVIADCGADMKPNILDLGTGTGCIIASLVKNIPCARGTAIEKSRSAIRVARYNIKNLGLKNYIHIIHGSFYSKNIVREKFDIIVSNPPYIASGDVRVDTGARHDPRCALYARDNGYAAYNAIAKTPMHGFAVVAKFIWKLAMAWVHAFVIYLRATVGHLTVQRQIYPELNAYWYLAHKFNLVFIFYTIYNRYVDGCSVNEAWEPLQVRRNICMWRVQLRPF